MLFPDFDERMDPWRTVTASRAETATRAAAARQVLDVVADQDPLRLPESGRVLVVGDVHGNAHYCRSVLEQAARKGIELVLQLGDTFGTHPDTAGAAMEVVSEACSRYDVDWVWLDGNHDRHPDVPLWPVHPLSGLHPVRPRVWHLPRGHSWQWRGTRWATVGGAVSIDAAVRTYGRSVWWEEEVTDEQLDAIVDDLLERHDGVDVLLTHDRPAWVELALGLTPGAWWLQAPGVWAEGDFHRSQAHQRRLDRLVAAVQPRLHLHGHLHRRYTLVSDLTPHGARCRVEGLSHEGLRAGNTLELPCAPDLDVLLAKPLVRGDAR